MAAATLHDVGYSPRIAQTGFHPLDGALHLRSIGLSERLCSLVAHHSEADMLAAQHGVLDLERAVPPGAVAAGRRPGLRRHALRPRRPDDPGRASAGRHRPTAPGPGRGGAGPRGCGRRWPGSGRRCTRTRSGLGVAARSSSPARATRRSTTGGGLRTATAPRWTASLTPPARRPGVGGCAAPSVTDPITTSCCGDRPHGHDLPEQQGRPHQREQRLQLLRLARARDPGCGQAPVPGEERQVHRRQAQQDQAGPLRRGRCRSPRWSSPRGRCWPARSPAGRAPPPMRSPASPGRPGSPPPPRRSTRTTRAPPRRPSGRHQVAAAGASAAQGEDDQRARSRSSRPPRTGG